MVSNLSAIVLTVLGCALYLPQLLLLLRTGSVAGLSSTSLLNGSVAYAAWACYLAAKGDVALTVATVIPGAVWWFVTTLAIPRMHPTPRTALVPAAVAFLYVGAYLVGGIVLLGAILAFSVAWSYVPAAVQAWRASDVSGISTLTWGLCAAEGVAWGAAGAAEGDLSLVSYGLIAAGSAAAVIAGARARRPSPNAGRGPDRSAGAAPAPTPA